MSRKKKAKNSSGSLDLMLQFIFTFIFNFPPTHTFVQTSVDHFMCILVQTKASNILLFVCWCDDVSSCCSIVLKMFLKLIFYCCCFFFIRFIWVWGERGEEKIKQKKIHLKIIINYYSLFCIFISVCVYRHLQLDLFSSIQLQQENTHTLTHSV